MKVKDTIITIVAVAVLAAGAVVSASAQKVEHYSSPLYSPRTYDPAASESNGMPAALKKVGIDQKLGDQLPLDTVFKNEDGQEVRLGDYFNKNRPVILALVYYECPMLCNQVLNGLTGSLKGIALEPGKDYDIVAISFDASENNKAGLAKNKKASYVERLAKAGAADGLHFLTGTQESIDQVANAAGFHYYWDDKSQQFAHVGGIMITTPEGKLSRYMYGIDYSPKDLKFGLMDSSQNKIGGVAQQLLLYCYHYDPATGKYGLAIMRTLRVAGVITLAFFGVMAFVFYKRGKKRRADEEGFGGPDTTAV
ncbi:MAG: SCO family protein [Pyrinomonadaceae bacterium]